MSPSKGSKVPGAPFPICKVKVILTLEVALGVWRELIPKLMTAKEGRVFWAEAALGMRPLLRWA